MRWIYGKKNNFLQERISREEFKTSGTKLILLHCDNTAAFFATKLTLLLGYDARKFKGKNKNHHSPVVSLQKELRW